jgi:hypothetical protein
VCMACRVGLGGCRGAAGMFSGENHTHTHKDGTGWPDTALPAALCPLYCTHTFANPA